MVATRLLGRAACLCVQ